ncbi:MAG: hypothetical protein ACE147_18170 [Candidatus Methylomirabilales bacterium]
MQDLDHLRQRLTPEQRRVLNLLWAEFRDRNRWLPREELHAETGEAPARAAVQGLGEAILRPGREDAAEDYRLTFLGVLLADEGPESEALLVRYLEYVRDRVRAEPGLEWVGSPEVEAALQLTRERSRHLRQLIRLSHWWGGGSGFGQREWTVGVPLDVDELPEHELAAYVRQHVLAHFLPGAAGQGLTIVPLAPPAPPRPPFWFLPDATLAERLAADWHEAQDVCQVRGWKSCVLLCGGILEATLRAALAAGDAASAAGAGAHPLAGLAPEAVRRGLLPEPLQLTPAVAQYRDLIAGRGQTVGHADADAALAAVRTCLRQLAARAAR